MKRFRGRRFAMLLILVMTFSLAFQGLTTVALAEDGDVSFDQSRTPDEGIEAQGLAEDQTEAQDSNPVNPSMWIATSVNKAEAWPGEKVVFTFEVTNTGNKNLYDVDVDDSLEPGGPSALKDIPVGESRTFSREYWIPDGARGSISNDGWADGWYWDRGWKTLQSNHHSAEVIVKWPGIELVKTADKSEVFYGETVHYTFAVKNSGTVPLYDIRIEDDQIGFEDSLDMLAAGNTHDFEASYTIPCPVLREGEGDIGLQCEPQFENCATVTGYLEDQGPVDDVTAACEKPPEYVTAESCTSVKLKQESLSLWLNKHVEADPELVPAAQGSGGPVVGERCLLIDGNQESVYYFFDLYNDGNAPLHTIVIHDPMLGDITVDGTLAAGEHRMVGPVAYPVSGVTDWPLINEAYASAKGYCKSTESNRDSACVNLAKITIEKTANPTAITLGAEVIYRLDIKNEGNMDLYQIEVNDDRIAYGTTIPYLAAGATASVDVPYTIQASDVVGGLFLNTASVTANTCSDQQQTTDEIYFIQCMEVSDSDDATVTVTVPVTTTETTVTTTTPGIERDRAEPPTVVITEAPVPLAAPVIVSPTPEPAPVILEEAVPLGVPVLPKTGEMNPALFYGLGGALTALGLLIRRKF